MYNPTVELPSQATNQRQEGQKKFKSHPQPPDFTHQWHPITKSFSAFILHGRKMETIVRDVMHSSTFSPYTSLVCKSFTTSLPEKSFTFTIISFARRKKKKIKNAPKKKKRPQKNEKNLKSPFIVLKSKRSAKFHSSQEARADRPIVGDIVGCRWQSLKARSTPYPHKRDWKMDERQQNKG